jgi:hypothetical protein
MSETTDHLLMGCNFFEDVWNLVAARFIMPVYNLLRAHQGLKACFSEITRSRSKADKKQKLGITFMTW